MGVTITGTGSYIPSGVATNEEFGNHRFYNEDGTKFGYDNDVIIEKFKAITGIAERRYISEQLTTSDIASFAAEQAIKDAGIDKETLDYIIVAHNYGDVKHGSVQSDTVPSIASRVKHNLKIKIRIVLLTICYLAVRAGWNPSYRQMPLSKQEWQKDAWSLALKPYHVL
jgi:3-oxoacyl-[acyl-carrier-protein] synthase III